MKIFREKFEDIKIEREKYPIIKWVKKKKRKYCNTLINGDEKKWVLQQQMSIRL